MLFNKNFKCFAWRRSLCVTLYHHSCRISISFFFGKIFTSEIFLEANANKKVNLIFTLIYYFTPFVPERRKYVNTRDIASSVVVRKAVETRRHFSVFFLFPCISRGYLKQKNTWYFWYFMPKSSSATATVGLLPYYYDVKIFI